MDSNTSVTIMFVAGFSSVALIVNTLLNYRLKSRAMRSGLLNPEGIRLLNQLNGDIRENALKWSLLLFFGGVGLVVLQYLPFPSRSPLLYGIESIFLAIGYFIYYLIIIKKEKI